MKKCLPALWMAGLLMFFSYNAAAQTWTGATNSNWFNAANWNPMAVPTATDAVTIPGSLTTYPTLTGNVTVGQLTMNGGSALHLAGFSFTDNGNATIQSAVVDGGSAFNIITPYNTDIRSNTITATIRIIDYTSNFYFLNNTVTGNVTLSDTTTQNTSTNFIDGNLITGNLSLTHNSIYEMDEGYSGATNDHITGNATFTIGGSGTFYGSYSHGLQVDGNLTINRTVAGDTYLFGTSGNIGGNFSFNAPGGNNTTGTQSATTTIGGTINISASALSTFYLYRLKNAVAGGTISAANPYNVDVRYDTLKANISITNYGSNFTVFNNSFTGNIALSNSTDQNTSNNYLDGNLITGNLNLTHNSTYEMDEGYGGGSGNHITGNTTFTIGGTGTFYSAYSHAIQVDGNLTVNRTVAGNTYLFGTTGSVGGNFNFSTPGGDNVVGTQNGVTPIGGTFSITSSSANVMYLYKLKNATSGGIVSVANPYNVDVRFDTLKATVSITNYGSSFTCFNNSITGNTTFSDAANQNTSNNYLDENLITGNLNLTHNSGYEMDEGYGGNGSNHITGNTTFTIGGTGDFYSSYSHGVQVDGNLTINRTAGGNTILFRTPGSVAGNMSYTTTGGSTTISDGNNPLTSIGGTLNINAAAQGNFRIYKIKNAIAGGTVMVANPYNVDVRYDTLKANISITNYGSNFTVFNNSFTGNITLSNSTDQNTSNNYLDGNLITGNLNLTHNSTYEMDEGYGGGSGNHITGNTTFAIGSSGTFYSAYSHAIQVDGNLTINRTTAGNTILFRSSGTVLGNFSFTVAGGDNTLNDNGNNVAKINGTIAINASSVSSFNLFKVKNGTAGGTVTVTNPYNVNIQNDTLLAPLTVSGYGSNFNVYNNSITGNSFFSDIAVQNTSNAYIDGNLFIGNLSIIHNSAYEFDESYGVGTGNIVTGSDSIVNTGTGALYIGYSHSTQVGKDFILNTSGSGTTTLNGVLFAGNTDSHIRQYGAKVVVFNDLYMSKTATGRVYPDTNVIVNRSLQFTTGIIVTNTNRNLIFSNGATVSGASNTAHIAGPVTKAGSQAFTFPTGTGSILAAIGISAPSTATDTIRAAFFYANPATAGYDTSSPHRDATLKRVSGCEYWDLTHVSGTSAVAVTLQYGMPCNGVNNLTALRVAHYNGTTWNDLGNGGVSGTNSSGMITSASTIASFSPFTLASTEDIIYILPITLTSFTARRINTTALLDWKITSEKDNRGFTIQRNSDGNTWTNIGYISSNGNTATEHTYSFTDVSPVKGRNFYRLLITDYNGKETYSPVRLIMMDDASGSGAIAVYPNPVSDVLYFSGDVHTITISNTVGKVIYNGQGAGSFNMQVMPAGIYLVRMTKEDGTSQTAKVIKL